MSYKKLPVDPWSLSYAERKAVTIISLFPEPVETMIGVGQPTINKLLAKGIAKNAGKHKQGMPLYGLTDDGKLVFDALAKASRVVR